MTPAQRIRYLTQAIAEAMSVPCWEFDQVFVDRLRRERAELEARNGQS